MLLLSYQRIFTDFILFVNYFCLLLLLLMCAMYQKCALSMLVVFSMKNKINMYVVLFLINNNNCGCCYHIISYHISFVIIIILITLSCSTHYISYISHISHHHIIIRHLGQSLYRLAAFIRSTVPFRLLLLCWWWWWWWHKWTTVLIECLCRDLHWMNEFINEMIKITIIIKNNSYEQMARIIIN